MRQSANTVLRVQRQSQHLRHIETNLAPEELPTERHAQKHAPADNGQAEAAELHISSARIQDLGKQLLQISRRQNKVLHIRTQLTFERQNLRYARTFEYESLQRLINTLQTALTGDSLQYRPENLAKLYHQCEADKAALEAKENQVTSLQNDLDVLEFRSLNKERRLAISCLELQGICAIEPTDETSDTSRRASTHVPSLLARYYDRKGDVGIQIERLDDLDEIYVEEKVRRDFLADQEQTLADSWTDFVLEYENKRRDILHALHGAREDVKLLEATCREFGVVIPTKPRSVSQSVSDQDFDANLLPTLTATADLPQRSKWSRDPDVAGCMLPRNAPKDVDSEVFAWLQGVSGDPIKSPALAMESLGIASKSNVGPEFEREVSGHHRSYSESDV